MAEDLKAALRASLKVIESEQDENKVVDLELERIGRNKVPNNEVKPIQVLELAIQECEQNEHITRCYITLIEENPNEPLGLVNLRCNLSRQEEVGFRQLGVAEAIDNWRS